MGILHKLFAGKSTRTGKSSKEIAWVALQSEDQLDQFREKGAVRPKLIFKHSATCGISRMVLRMFEELLLDSNKEADLYFLDVHRSRAVSNAVSRQFGVRHQSPQLLIVKQGQVITEASHGAIADIDLNSYL